MDPFVPSGFTGRPTVKPKNNPEYKQGSQPYIFFFLEGACCLTAAFVLASQAKYFSTEHPFKAGGQHPMEEQ